MTRFTVVGGGIVGLGIAREVMLRSAGATVTVLEKEPTVGAHQTGHNSGVLHSGLYYKPGSLKARLCVQGNALMRSYCAEHGIEIKDSGKLVVAAQTEELPRLQNLLERGRTNGVPDLQEVPGAEIQKYEPYATGVRAIYSPHTSILDYGAVCRALSSDVRERGGEVLLESPVTDIRPVRSAGFAVRYGGPQAGAVNADVVITCAGLQSDRIAQLAGDSADPRIVPFRGEYYSLRAAARGLVRGLIYPVPDPQYPFLGVHFTPTMRGDVMVGPNAVLAFAREGYTRWTVNIRDMVDTATWPGFRHLARQHWRMGANEMYRSVNKSRYLASARRYLPSLAKDDLVPAPAGVRAQAVGKDGALVDDFWISRHAGVVNVRNAPSPAATSSLAIAKYIFDEYLEEH